MGWLSIRGISISERLCYVMLGIRWPMLYEAWANVSNFHSSLALSLPFVVYIFRLRIIELVLIE